ncbi:MAG: pantoate--beta-alanine ligase [Ktedonobacteraceae bacterium]|nr:pantoate--beta-alanine ligase [Ktedonobacteraceae bacterium]
MRIIHDLDEMMETARGWLSRGTVGFVPTMGHLHAGHLSLIQAARRECEISVVGIFVSPSRFKPGKGRARFPRDLARDLFLLDSAGVDVVFIPRSHDLYPANLSTYVTPTGPLAERLEGTLNPGYFRRMATTVTRLFQVVRPDIAYFSQKDAQTVAVLRKMVRDLNIDITLGILPTVREQDGLAISTRNASLSRPERQAATVLYRALLAGKALIQGGELRPPVIEKAMGDMVLAEPGVGLNYAAVCDPETFQELTVITSRTLLIVSATIGSIRLTDNILWLGDGTWLI